MFFICLIVSDLLKFSSLRKSYCQDFTRGFMNLLILIKTTILSTLNLEILTFHAAPVCLAIELNFSLARIILLIIWFLVCMYCAQQIQYSQLVSKGHKTTASLGALFLGPFLYLFLMILDAYDRASQNEKSIVTKLKNTISGVRFSTSSASKDLPIKLLDSSGRSINEIYGHGDRGRNQKSHILELTDEIIFNALEERASDILIDPKTDTTYTIRFRVDGVLRTVEQLDSATCQAVINSIKAVSNMDISDKRRPQDGAFIARTMDDTVSFRVASAGVLSGEKLSIRVLHQDVSRFKLTSIGLGEKQRQVIEEMIKKPSGMILLSGPTGSGKTTTLYAMLQNIDRMIRNVITVEDPIEYVLPNASQIEVNPKADITFAKSLRSILRQDPDIICIGEIRDEETAGIALRAAQTGHLVIATVHSNSNASALIRLLDLGVSPLLLSSGLNLIITQRLIRKLCNRCKVTAQLTPLQIQNFRKKKINYANIQQAVGCDYCNGTGYYERTGIYDFLVVDNKLKASIAQNKISLEELRKEGDKRGRSNLQKQALLKVVSGVTSIEEMSRVLG